MNSIAKHINLLGLLLLMAFVATAAAMYLDLPVKGNRTPIAATGSYSCPMHPEVVSSQPDDCPKCGMALAQRAAGKSVGCLHSMSDVASDSGTAAEHAGCAHEASGGGCCSSPPPTSKASLPPGGCTRSLYPQLEPALK